MLEAGLTAASACFENLNFPVTIVIYWWRIGRVKYFTLPSGEDIIMKLVTLQYRMSA